MTSCPSATSASSPSPILSEDRNIRSFSFLKKDMGAPLAVCHHLVNLRPKGKGLGGKLPRKAHGVFSASVAKTALFYKNVHPIFG
jgi:hypothetical protein